MKNTLILIASILSLSAPLAAEAQSDTTAPTPATFLNSVENYFGAFGTNTWAGEHGYVETGAAYQNQVNIASTLELGVPVYHTGTNSAVFVDSETLNAGIAGTLVSQEIDVAWVIGIHDVQLQIGAGPGYDFTTGKVYPGLFGEAQKKLTPNTHAFIRLGEQWEGKKSIPIVAVGVGFSF